MKISVAMATYNGEKYIVEQLESIRTQTMPVDEVRICDDCSTDDTVKVVREYLKEHGLEDTWSITVNEHNLGYASNFMKAVRKTSGEYIFFCDQDDIWIPDRIEKMVKIMDTHEHIMLLGSEFEPFASTADAPSVPKWELRQFKNDGSLEKKKFNAGNIFIGCQGCTMCLRRKLINKTYAYWYDGWAHDEYAWKMALCMDGLYVYHSYTLKRRLHSTNVTMRKVRSKDKRIKYLRDLIDSHEATLKYILKHGAEPRKVRLLERNIKAAKLRIALLEDKNYFNTVKLILGYSDCYHKRRAIPVEIYMALKS
jgi:glycosyltransferase involved in cell wall biosynthesis